MHVLFFRIFNFLKSLIIVTIFKKRKIKRFNTDYKSETSPLGSVFTEDLFPSDSAFMAMRRSPRTTSGCPRMRQESGVLRSSSKKVETSRTAQTHKNLNNILGTIQLKVSHFSDLR